LVRTLQPPLLRHRPVHPGDLGIDLEKLKTVVILLLAYLPPPLKKEIRYADAWITRKNESG